MKGREGWKVIVDVGESRREGMKGDTERVREGDTERMREREIQKE